MRDVPLSNTEREFLLGIIAEKKRVDGRHPTQFRDIKVQFGSSYGSCQVHIGQTRVLAHVSGEVTAPKSSRPHEGILHVNIELSPMAHPSFEQGRQTEETVQLSRLMERCLKDSCCVDLESLCIVSGEKVWTLRVDISVLNHEGNLLDCASIAAIAALKHSRRPDVTATGDEVTIHTATERDPICLSVHHMPLCVTFAFFHQGKCLLMDPTEREERVTEGKMMIGQNKHREICMMQVTGQMLLHPDQVKQCTKMAQVKVMEITDLIQEALANDKDARARGEKSGFAVYSDKGTINTTVTDPKVVEPPPPADMSSDSASDAVIDVDSDSDSDGHLDMAADSRLNGDAPRNVADGVALLGTAAVQKWEEEEKAMEGDLKGNKRGSADSPENQPTAAAESPKPATKHKKKTEV